MTDDRAPHPRPLPPHEPLSSLWKYVVIAVALVVGILYTMPNFFPEVPAVQVSSSKAASRSTAALLGTVEDALKAADIPYRGAALDPTGIKVRFADPDTQLKAKDVLQAKLGDNYIVALNLLSSSPQWLAAIGALPMYLGLDLRGGVHFLLQVDMKAALDKAADRYTTDIRSLLREKKVQYARRRRAKAPTSCMRFRDEAERTKARAAIEKTYPDLAAARDRRQRRRPAARRGAEARGAEAHPGRRRRSRTSRSCAIASTSWASPSRSSSSRAPSASSCSFPACRTPRARRTSSAAPRRSKSAWSTTSRARSKQRSAGSVPLGSDLFTERNGEPLRGAAAGRAHRRPHQRRAAGLRPAHQRARRARQPRRHRRAASSRKSRARTSASAWRSCWSRRARPK